MSFFVKQVQCRILMNFKNRQINRIESDCIRCLQNSTADSKSFSVAPLVLGSTQRLYWKREEHDQSELAGHGIRAPVR